MPTIDHAKRAVELSEQRDALMKTGSRLRRENIQLAVIEDQRSRYSGECDRVLIVEQLNARLRDLIKEEVAAQVARLDDEIRALGFEPDEFDAAAPSEVHALDTSLQRAGAAAIRMFADSDARERKKSGKMA